MITKHHIRAAAAALVLVLFTGVMFRQVFLQGRIIAPLDIVTKMLAPWRNLSDTIKPHNHYAADAVTQYLPYRMFCEKSLREDGYIGWNPYEMGGYSLAANTMALPGSWAVQLHRFLPFKDAWNVGIISEFLVAGVGMLTFLRWRRSLPWIPCLIGALAYMGNSQFIIWIYHRWALGSFCWMPWVLWAAPNGSGEGISRRTLLLPFFLTLAILGGSLQHLAMVVIACGCVFAGGLTSLRRPAGMLRPAALWSAAFILALLITAFSLLPQIMGFFDNNNMGHVRGAIGYEEGWRQPLFQVLLIPAQSWPWLMGDPRTLDAFRLFKCGFMDIAYMGTIPMLLAIAGLFRASMPRQAKWLVLAGLLIPLTPLVGPLYHRVQLLFLLGGAWMAAEMIAKAPSTISPKLQRLLVSATAAIGLALLVGTLLPGSVRGSIEKAVSEKAVEGAAGSYFKPDEEWVRDRALGWTRRFSLIHRRTGILYLVLAAGVGGCVLCARKNQRDVTIGRFMILGATSFELLVFASTWNSFTDPQLLNIPNASIDTVRAEAGDNRVLQRSPKAGFTDIFATPNTLAARFIKSVDAYESIQYPSTASSLEALPAGPRLTLAGVGIAVHPSNLPPPDGTNDWPVSQITGGYSIRTNPNVPAPVTAGTAPLPSGPEDIISQLKSARSVRPELETMNRWAFTIPDGASWIRISQNWHSGWKWRAAGGEWQGFIRGADATCWIDHPPQAGTAVEVRFFPYPPWLGWLSLAALSIAVATSIVLIPARFRGASGELLENH